MAARLKLYRTATGFHDAYVAAPSRAAALRAWGTDKDLFARKAAEEVEDAGMLEQLSAEPGRVFRTLRGSADEQLEALGPLPAPQGPASGERAQAKRKRAPKPSNRPVSAARAVLTALDRSQKQEREDLVRREAELQHERRNLESGHAAAMREARAALAEADATYAEALEDWQRTR